MKKLQLHTNIFNTPKGILCLLLGVLLSCSNESDKQTYLGGQIINPKDDRLYIQKPNTEILDTLDLQDNGLFSYPVKEVIPGIYTFKHGGEIQMIFIEPGDSILLRLNTQDFDESLVFTGKGAFKNNFFINLFLDLEKDSKKITKGFQLKPEAFHSFINNIRDKHHGKWQKVKNENDFSESFDSVVRARIDFTLYAYKERYPFSYFGRNRLIHYKDLPQNFYNYRNNLNINTPLIGSLNALYGYLFWMIDNRSLNAFFNNEPYHLIYNNHDEKLNQYKLRLIDSLITMPFVKNNLLNYKFLDFVNRSNNLAVTQKLFSTFREISSNSMDIVNMENLITAKLNFQIGQKIPMLDLIHINGVKRNTKSFNGKPTVIYFWSAINKKLYRQSKFRAQELSKNYPNINFVSINMDTWADNKQWRKSIGDLKNEESLDEYKLEAPSILPRVFLNQTLVLNKNGKIVSSSKNLFTKNLEKFLHLLNQ